MNILPPNSSYSNAGAQQMVHQGNGSEVHKASRKRGMPTPSPASSKEGSPAPTPLTKKRVRFDDSFNKIDVFKKGSPPSQAVVLYKLALSEDLVDVYENWHVIDSCVDYAKRVLQKYKEAADKGSKEAIDKLANFAQEELAQEPLSPEARLRKFADKGLACAQYFLGQYYLGEMGVAENLPEAIAWFQRAAERGHANAYYYVGCCHLQGRVLDQNPAIAVDCFRKAANNNHDGAMHELAKCLLEGKGVERSPEEAVKWLKKAAEVNEGNFEALTDLGLCYLEGTGVEQDPETAADYLSFASEAEKASRAQYHLGLGYINGICSGGSPEVGLELIRQAAYNQYPDALAYLNEQQR
jgi:TPR repeat protein